jgi:hypothetical protein
MTPAIRPCALPPGALLARYAEPALGAYTDAFVMKVPGAVQLARDAAKSTHPDRRGDPVLRRRLESSVVWMVPDLRRGPGPRPTPG